CGPLWDAELRSVAHELVPEGRGLVRRCAVRFYQPCRVFVASSGHRGVERYLVGYCQARGDVAGILATVGTYGESKFVRFPLARLPVAGEESALAKRETGRQGNWKRTNLDSPSPTPNYRIPASSNRNKCSRKS